MSNKLSHIIVLKPGITSIQDSGRFGFLSEGIPVAGFMDRISAGLANGLVGNKPGAALIEWAILAPKLQFKDVTTIALTGVEVKAFVNNKEVFLNKKISIPKNGILSFGKVTKGIYGYVAIEKGIKTTKVLGSRSWYPDITENTFFNKEVKIPFVSSLSINNSNVRLKTSFHAEGQVTLNVFKGPEFDLLTKSQKELLFNTTFSTGIQRDRMGVQLIPEFNIHTYSILSSPTLSGTVQWTSSGKLIVLSSNAQTIGGYPRILQLSKGSVSELSQLNGLFKFNLIN